MAVILYSCDLDEDMESLIMNHWTTIDWPLGKTEDVYPPAYPIGSVYPLGRLGGKYFPWSLISHLASFPLERVGGGVGFSKWPFSWWRNMWTLPQRTKDFLAQPLMNAFPSVDTFFLLSGTMASYGLLRKVQNTRRFNPCMFYLLRVLRLVGDSTPSCSTCSGYWG